MFGVCSPPTINRSVSVLRFFFTVMLDHPDLSWRVVSHSRFRPQVNGESIR